MPSSPFNQASRTADGTWEGAAGRLPPAATGFATCSIGNAGRLALDIYHEDEVKLLKQIARDYILSSPSLAAQQMGQRRILESHFHDFYDEIKTGKPKVLPRRFYHLIDYDGFAEPASIATAELLTLLS